MSLVAALNIARAHFYLIKTSYSPYVDERVEALDEHIRSYLEGVYAAHEPDVFEHMEKLAWESVLNQD